MDRPEFLHQATELHRTTEQWELLHAPAEAGISVSLVPLEKEGQT